MRVFAVIADVSMGSILGIFLFAVLMRIAPSLGRPAMAAFLIVAAIIGVLCRRPNGSFAMRQNNR